MNATGHRPLEQVSCCHDVPEYHDQVQPTYGSELSSGYLLDGRFRLGEPLSRSGMGIIYKAEDVLHENQPVAVKVPHLSHESDPVFFRRFQREEEIGQKLDHPFLLRFIPVEKKSRPYIVTEYLRGCTLAHLLDAMRPLPEPDALQIAGLLCEALQNLHEQGVVHRDLKPANIMICCDRTIRLMDFGIASATDSRRITISGFTPAMGTPDYMAPEQVENKRSDERTDIYGLGVILYEMLTGVLPFRDENPWVAMNNRVTGDPTAPRELNPKLSPQAEEIVLHALQRNPADRYATAAAMKADVDAPDKVQITGFCNHLQAPRWRFNLRETPMLAGTALGLGFIAMQAVLFLLLRHFLAK